ncbi:hypothetical protein [Brevundimonas sp. FT23028]|uniref:hypothetical protein n=1 Tax=Brevundimonas sp. FT23028 TaxID=3393748 RepID=UPI003B589D7D
MRAFISVAAAAAMSVPFAAMAQDGVVSGTGSAVVTRDANATRANAEAAARADLVRNMARQVLGVERLGELTPDLTTRLANQITGGMIVDRSSERVGQEFRVTLSARIDRAWFQARLDDEGVSSSSARAGGQASRILIMLDEAVGPSRDTNRPVEVTTEYDRFRGSTFSDTSSLSYSDREAELSASQRSGAYASWYGAGASRRTDVDAYGRSTRLEDRNNVQSTSVDATRYRQHVVYQATATTQVGQAAVAALTGELLRYDVATANGMNALAQFSPGAPPLFTELRDSGQLTAFLADAWRTSRAPFFMGGQLSIQDNGRSPNTGQATCTGQLYAQAFATSTSQDIAATSKSGENAASSYELCAARLSENLARLAAEELGPQVQRYWRDQSRGMASAVAAAQGPADYTLIIRGVPDMGAQADVLDALQGLPGVQSHAFLGQEGSQMSLQVRYDGSTPLHLALYQRLRGKPGFANATSETVGRQVIVCLPGGC